ncbi:MAG: hypothetical protein AAAB35_17560 [Phyllobacterium sp.]|uniref:hypothetical protein n=1 Tax=Phyllobacterium sp. TaxID=1871046 RepID=UPI0030F32392
MEIWTEMTLMRDGYLYGIVARRDRNSNQSRNDPAELGGKRDFCAIASYGAIRVTRDNWVGR